MDILQATAAAIFATVALPFLYISDLFGIGTSIGKSIWNIFKVSLIFFVFAFFVVLTIGRIFDLDQPASFTFLDKLWECGPFAFGAENMPLDLGAFTILEYVWIVPSILRTVTLDYFMRINAGIVYIRQSIGVFVTFIFEIVDFTNPIQGVIDVVFNLFELLFSIFNVLIEVPLLRLPNLSVVFEVLYLWIECFFLWFREVLFLGATLTIFSQNCGFCSYNLEIVDPNSCLFMNITTDGLVFGFTIFPDQQSVDFIVKPNCTDCNSPLCTLSECTFWGIANVVDAFTVPCFNYSIEPIAANLTRDFCCLWNAQGRLLFIVIGSFETVIRQLPFFPVPGTCMTDQKLLEFLFLYYQENILCLDQLVCDLTAQEQCSFWEFILDQFEFLKIIIDGIFGLISCTEDLTTQFCFSNYIQQFVFVGYPPFLGTCTAGGLSACSTRFTDCLTTYDLWTPAQPFFLFVNTVIDMAERLPCFIPCFTNAFQCIDSATGCFPSTFSGCFFNEINPCVAITAFPYFPDIASFMDSIAFLISLLDPIFCWFSQLNTCFNVNDCAGKVTEVGKALCYALCLATNIPTAVHKEGNINNYQINSGVYKAISPYSYDIVKHVYLSNDLPIRNCIMEAMYYKMEECINGCPYDHLSCNKEYKRTKWQSDRTFVMKEFQRFRSLGDNDNSGNYRRELQYVYECDGPQFFSTVHQITYRIPEKTPFENHIIASYFTCILSKEAKDSRQQLSLASKNNNMTTSNMTINDYVRQSPYYPTIQDRITFFNVSRLKSLKWRPLSEITQSVNWTVYDVWRYSWSMIRSSDIYLLLKRISSMNNSTFQNECKRIYRSECNELKRLVVLSLINNYTYYGLSDKKKTLWSSDGSSSSSNSGSISGDNGNGGSDSQQQRHYYWPLLNRQSTLHQRHYNKLMINEGKEQEVFGNHFDERDMSEDFFSDDLKENQQQQDQLTSFYNQYIHRQSLERSVKRYGWAFTRLANKWDKRYRSNNRNGEGNLQQEDETTLEILNNAFCFVFDILPDPTPKSSPQEQQQEIQLYNNQSSRLLPFGNITNQQRSQMLNDIRLLSPIRQQYIKRQNQYVEKLRQTYQQFSRYKENILLQKVHSAAMRYYDVHKWSSYQFVSLLYHGAFQQKERLAARWLQGDPLVSFDAVTGDLLEYPFEIPRSPDPPIWDASTEVRLGVFLLGINLRWIFELVHVQFPNFTDDGSPFSYRRHSIFELMAMDEQTLCFERGTSYSCYLLQQHQFQLNSTYKKYNLPSSIKYFTREQFRNERAYEEYLGTGDPAIFNSNSWFVDLADAILNFLLPVGESLIRTFADKALAIIQAIGVLEQLELFVQRLDESFDCTWPTNVNGSTIYNIFCFPLVPATLGRWVVPIPNMLIQPQIQWPKELIVKDCISPYNGRSFPPELQESFINKSIVFQFSKDIQTFKLSNSCLLTAEFGWVVDHLPSSSVDETSELIAIGSPSLSPSAGSSGSVEFRLADDPSIEPPLFTLVAENPTESEQYGRALDITLDGQSIAIGAPTGRKNTGYACVYRRLPSDSGITKESCSYFDQITNDSVPLNEEGALDINMYGRAVFITDNLLFVGAPAYNVSKGRVYALLRSINEPLPIIARLEDFPALPSFSWYGWVIKGQRDVLKRLFIAQPAWNNSMGQLFIYRVDGTEGPFVLEAVLQSPIPTTDGWFSLSIAAPSRVVWWVVCGGEPGTQSVHCFRLDDIGNGTMIWTLSTTIIGIGIGFGNHSVMNETHIHIAGSESPTVFIYEFTGNYTGVILVDSIDSLSSDISSLSFNYRSPSSEQQQYLVSVVGHSVNEVVFVQTPNGSQVLLTFNQSAVEALRPLCPICDWCPRDYLPGGCRSLKFKDFLYSISFLIAWLPQILNFLFRDGISLSFLEQTLVPITLFWDLIAIVISIIICTIPPLWAGLLTTLPVYTFGFYVFLWGVKLFWGDGLPVAPLIIIAMVILSGVLFFFPPPPFATYTEKIKKKFLFLRRFVPFLLAATAILFITQIVFIFTPYGGVSFSINKELVALIDRIKGLGYLTSINPVLNILRERLATFIFEDPLNIPSVDVLCFILSFYDLFYFIIAVPLILLFGWFILRALWKLWARLSGWFAAWSLVMGLIYESFQTNA